jgi:lipopolysaccharide transport system ATP-binding protein
MTASSEIAVEAAGLYKKFKKGEIYTSLRDLVPAMTRRALGGAADLEAREFWAVRDVSFQVPRGEAFGVIGHNGAGKSTMLKLLSGIMKPTAGTLSVKGRLSALIEIGAGFHPDLTGRENVYLYGTILGMRREEIRRKFDAIVDFSGLGEFIDTPVKRYSSGMYARLGFSVSAHVEPDVLLVDEILSVGDFLFQRRSLEKMRAVLKSGTTVLFVSHNMRAVGELCSRSILLQSGAVAAMGPTSDVIQHYMQQAAGERKDLEAREAYVSAATLRGKSGEPVLFSSGETITAEVEVTANRPCQKLAVVIECRDDDQYDIFNTSTERLGAPSFSLEAGQKWRAQFQLTLHLAPGTYHFGVYVYRYDIQKNYDTLVPARTFHVASADDVRGVAHLEPRVVAQGLAES